VFRCSPAAPASRYLRLSPLIRIIRDRSAGRFVLNPRMNLGPVHRPGIRMSLITQRTSPAQCCSPSAPEFACTTEYPVRSSAARKNAVTEAHPRSKGSAIAVARRGCSSRRLHRPFRRYGQLHKKRAAFPILIVPALNFARRVRANPVQMLNPNPVPFARGFVVKNGSNFLRIRDSVRCRRSPLRSESPRASCAAGHARRPAS